MFEREEWEDQPPTKMCEFPAESDSEEVKILANNPKYACMDCGEFAASCENLCRPEKMLS